MKILKNKKFIVLFIVILLILSSVTFLLFSKDKKNDSVFDFFEFKKELESNDIDIFGYYIQPTGNSKEIVSVFYNFYYPFKRPSVNIDDDRDPASSIIKLLQNDGWSQEIGGNETLTGSFSFDSSSYIFKKKSNYLLINIELLIEDQYLDGSEEENFTKNVINDKNEYVFNVKIIEIIQ